MRGAFECGLLRFTGTGMWLDSEASGTALIAIDGGDVKETAKPACCRISSSAPPSSPQPQRLQ